MSIKENRPLAWGVLAAVVIGCTLASGGIGLNREQNAVRQEFFAAGESIYADAVELADNAYVLLGIAQRYDGFDQALLERTQQAVQSLRDALARESIGEAGAASKELTDCVEDLYTAAGDVSMKGNDPDDFRYKYKNFTSANLRISHDPYNDSAAEFNRLRGGFPARLIASVCGVDELERFN